MLAFSGFFHLGSPVSWKVGLIGGYFLGALTFLVARWGDHYSAPSLSWFETMLLADCCVFFYYASLWVLFGFFVIDFELTLLRPSNLFWEMDRSPLSLSL
jgi:hypothetical protein